MRSAVIIARQKAEEEAARLRPETSGKPSGDPDDLKNVRVETEAVIFEGGKAFLKGNPLHTTKEIICPDCRLPRLQHPLTGEGARPPPDDREYCQKQPPIIKQGHDIHGNPFASDKVNTKKKKQATNANTPGSSPPTTPDGSFKHAAPERVGYPMVKCPNCPRYFVTTRVAQHLDRCLGLSSRGNRNKPQPDSSTTNAAAAPKRPFPAGEDEIPPVTKKKKLGGPKKLTGQKPPPPSKLKNGTTPDMMTAAEAGGDGESKDAANGDANA